MGSTTATSASVGPVLPATVGGGGGGSTPPTAGGGGTSPPGGRRFFQSPLWRTIITDLDGRLIVLMDRRLFNRSAAYVLDSPSQFQGSCASDDPRVLRVWSEDGKNMPAVAEGARLLYAFRQEDPTGLIPWTCRFAGPILNVNDRTDSDRPVTDITAMDPWQYLFSVPVVDSDGDPLGPDGLRFVDERGSNIATQILYNALFASADFNDWIDFLSVFWGGTIEDTAKITTWEISQGTSIGQAWKDLCATGTLDIVLTPIYDPINRPGTCSELSIFAQAGHNRWNAVFGWDKFTKSLTEMTRLLDGTARANIQDWYAGQGGVPVGQLSDADSLSTYGAYWRQQFETGNAIKTSVELLAEQALQLAKFGAKTFTLKPAPERGPFPFTEWYLGDCIFPYATSRFREAVDGSTGPIVMSNVGAAGTGYAEGDTGSIDGGTGDATYQVDAIDGSGGVAVYHLLTTGTAYSNSEGATTTATTGGGSGFTLNIGCGLRVYGFTVDIDDNSVETVTPALVSPS